MTATLRLHTSIIAALICLAAVIILLPSVFAQDATSSATKRGGLEVKKDKVESRISAMKEKLATREAALKAKLEAFKDKKKAEVADRVNTNLNKINQNQTNQMKRHLEKMSALLVKLETRVNNSTSDIKDPQVSKAAIEEARTAIATATEAVSAQAEKDYTLSITSESRVKTEAKTKRDELHKDIQTTRELVIKAKQSVGSAIRVAKSGKIKEGTASGRE